MGQKWKNGNKNRLNSAFLAYFYYFFNFKNKNNEFLIFVLFKMNKKWKQQFQTKLGEVVRGVRFGKLKKQN